jgi:hypothetical protein
MRVSCRQGFFLICTFAFVLIVRQPLAHAQGGPPLISDDPDTPGPGYWEINMSSLIEKSRQGRRIEAPFADINYGVGKRIQLKFEVPWLSVHEPGLPTQRAMGNSNVGVKWRFLGQEHRTVAWSIYPQLQTNTGDRAVEKGIVERGRQFFMPTELTLELGRIEINNEIGRRFVQHGADSWEHGISTEVGIHPRFELLAEMHTEWTHASPTEIILNLGGRQKLTPKMILLMAVGRAVHGSVEERPQLRLYIGLQLNLPRQYPFDDVPR